MSNGNLKLRRIAQINNGSGLTISTSDVLSQFNIPANRVWNLQESYLQFDVSLAAGTNLNTLFTDSIPMRNIQLLNSSGTAVAVVNNAQQFTKIVRPVYTSMEEYLANGAVYANTTIANALQTESHQLQPAHRALGITTSAQILANQPNNNYVTHALTYSVAVGGASTASVPTTVSGPDADYISPQYVAAGGSAAITMLRMKIPLSAFKGTLLNHQGGIMFPEQMRLDIYYLGVQNWGFDGTVAAASPVNLGTITLSNYYLYMFENISDNIIQDWRARLSTGVVVNTPYVVANSYTTAANLSGSMYQVSQPIDGRSGILKRIFTCPMLAGGNNVSTCNSDNVAQIKWTTVQTMLDSKPVSADWYLDNALNETYNALKPKIKHSPIGMTNRIYNISSFWMDDFTNTPDSVQWNYTDETDEGLILGQDAVSNYAAQFNINTNSSLAFYQYYIWGRKLVMSNANGVQWA